MYIIFDEKTKKVINEPTLKKPIFVRKGLKVAEVDMIPETYDYLTAVNEQVKTRVVQGAYVEKVIDYDKDGNEIEIDVLHEEVIEDYDYCELIANFKPAPSEEEKVKAQAKVRIAELKGLLSATDYLAIKYAEGWITAEDYAEIKAQRQTYRNEINELEALLVG